MDRRNTWLLLSTAVCIVALLPSCKPIPDETVRRLDSLTDHALKEYSEGTAERARVALLEQVAYIESHHSVLATRRETNTLLLVSSAMLAYIDAYRGETNSALSNLTDAYHYHERSREKSGKAPLPATNFVQFIFAGVEEVDRKAGAVWKRQSSLDTNMVNALSEIFSDLNSTHQP